jgi:16S rRNA (guanine527-N7)-methyltransferase
VNDINTIRLERLQQGLLALDLATETAPALLRYLELLERWNKVYNLTAVRRLDDMIERHIMDSLAVHTWLYGTTVFDVGSGAGLPGIPLALMNPDRHFCLLDSNSKKTRFMTQTAVELQLSNVTVRHARIEHFQPAQRFDTVLSRAFASLSDFITLAGPYCASEGRLLALKGSYPIAELDELPKAYQFVAAHPLDVPGLDAERHLVHVAPA